MRLLIATDAWSPQINGVVRSISKWAQHAEHKGVSLVLLTHDAFPTMPLPTYPLIRLALPRQRIVEKLIESVRADAVHIATEGPIGHAAKRYCIENGIRFTTYFHSRFAEYVRLRFPIPKSWIWTYLRRFHAGSQIVMVGTQALAAELANKGFDNLSVVPLGVDTQFFNPGRKVSLEYRRPIFLSAGRIAVEKNLEAFLALELPGTKLVVGDGPERARLARRFPDAVFVGAVSDARLADYYASADVFVFPSRIDTFGLVLLEALSSGLPIACFPAQATQALLHDSHVAILDEDLREACMRALALSRDQCRRFALDRNWEMSAERFLSFAT